jgi:Putative zinc-finger
MDHTEAIRIKAPEQYLLGELPGPVRDEFEEHFLTCQECAQDLRASAAFISNAREVLRQEPARQSTAVGLVPRRQGWLAAIFRPAVAAPALLVLLALAGYQGLVVIPRMESALSKANAPASIASFSLLGGSTRGQASVPVVVRPGQPFTLYIDIPPQPAFPLYTLDVESAQGAFEFSLHVSAAEAKNTVEVFVPASRLAPGDYAMVIHGSPSQGKTPRVEVGRVRFSLRYSDAD